MQVKSAVETSTFQERPGYSSHTMTRITVHGPMAALGQTVMLYRRATSGIIEDCRVRINHFPQTRVSQPRYRRTPSGIPREIVENIGSTFNKYHEKFQMSLEILRQVLSGINMFP
jgi:hypothetical protein